MSAAVFVSLSMTKDTILPTALVLYLAAEARAIPIDDASFRAASSTTSPSDVESLGSTATIILATDWASCLAADAREEAAAGISFLEAATMPSPASREFAFAAWTRSSPAFSESVAALDSQLS